MQPVNRRTFVAASSAALLTPIASSRASIPVPSRPDGGLADSFPSQDPSAVREVVAKAHVDYDAVRDLVTARPALAKATWDWGFGDWESALGAASHMGRRDIAELLIEHGARPNLFTFAMLGQVDVVRAFCEANPGIQRLHGPHGLSLMHHARMGGDAAAAVVEYLQTLGEADLAQAGLAIEEPAARPYLGRYRPNGATQSVFLIDYHQRMKAVTFKRDDRQMRFLKYRGGHVFNPGGASSVDIVFEVREGLARRLAIRDGGLEITAERME